MSQNEVATGPEPVDPITILLIGRTGVGKSSTVNSLFGSQVAPVGHYEATTKDVVCYRHVHDSIEYAIWDTPGLCDDLPESGNDDRYLADVVQKVRKPDCVWFVTPLNETRITSDERRGIKLITQALGQEIWSKAIVVFSRSDECSPDRFSERLGKRGDLIRDLIDGTIRTVDPAQATVHKTFAQSIPSIPVANGDEGLPPRLLPNGKTWIGELFTTVLERIDSDARAGFLASMVKEIGPVPRKASAGEGKQGSATAADSGSSAGSSAAGHGADGPRIPLDEDQQSRVAKIAKRVVAGMSTGATIGGKIGKGFGGKGGAIGAAVGAVIGGVLGAFGWL